MKTYSNYLKKQERVIITLLEKPRKQYTPEIFHQLRVEIKKLNAFFELIEICSNDFERKKTFKPFKLIFGQAGKVRELQVEEDTLKKYFTKKMLKGYRTNLKLLILKEQKIYFLIVNKTMVNQLKKKLNELKPFLTQMDKKKLKSYMDRKRKKIKRLLDQKIILSSPLHELRKQLKKFYFNQKSLSWNSQNKLVSKKDNLPQLLGRWNDFQVIRGHLKKVADAGKIDSKGKSKLEKVTIKISSEAELLLNKINEAIPDSKFLKSTV